MKVTLEISEPEQQVFLQDGKRYRIRQDKPFGWPRRNEAYLDLRAYKVCQAFEDHTPLSLFPPHWLLEEIPEPQPPQAPLMDNPQEVSVSPCWETLVYLHKASHHLMFATPSGNERLITQAPNFPEFLGYLFKWKTSAGTTQFAVRRDSTRICLGENRQALDENDYGKTVSVVYPYAVRFSNQI